MKKFGFYSIGWLLFLGLFNVITFVTPNEYNGISKFTASFWVAYVFITVAFIGQLACAYYIFNVKKTLKPFYSIPVLAASITSLVLITLVGSLFMAIIVLPPWIGIIICAFVLVLNIVYVAKSAVAVEMVADVDKKIKVKTIFIKLLTADAETLVAKAEGEELAAIAHKVYEAIRYSDPMSDDALASVEDKITMKFNELSEAFDNKDIALAESFSKQLLIYIAERNSKCRVLK